ncbi:50S ribosomal protein L4 [bacterium]|nr:50S ribosomal protein L4 [bacterium]
MKIPVYNQEGKEIENMVLPKEVFGIKMNLDLVHQVVVSQMANRRKPIAHTKDRGEVRGGGRKPWRQKGTGRARAGSNRSPIWIGGGVTFGPRKEKKFKKRIPKKMKRKALFMVLSEKARRNQIVLLDKFDIKNIKTKIVFNVLSKIPLESRNALIILPKYDKNIILSSRNIPKIDTCQAKDINALDILSFKYLVMPKESIKVIKETFVKKPKSGD